MSSVTEDGLVCVEVSYRGGVFPPLHHVDTLRTGAWDSLQVKEPRAPSEMGGHCFTSNTAVNIRGVQMNWDFYTSLNAASLSQLLNPASNYTTCQDTNYL